VQVSLGLFASITVYSHEEFEDKVQKQLNTTFKSNNTDFLKHLHKFQIHVINLRHTIYQKFKSDFKFRCCGIEGPQDYKDLPASCCEKQKEPCIYPYIVGCIKPITLECENEIKTIGYVSLVFAINEVSMSKKYVQCIMPLCGADIWSLGSFSSKEEVRCSKITVAYNDK
jgi:hypothetical protein